MLALVGLALCGWYSTRGSDIIDENGKVVRITGIAWYGYETSKGVVDGLWSAGMHDVTKSIADMGFNCVRLPIAASVIHEWMDGKPQPWSKWGDSPTLNPDLVDKDNLFAFNLLLADLKKYGIKAFLDIHGIWPDGYDQLNLWYNGSFPPEYILSALEWAADYFKEDDTMIGIDLKNEPHGGCTDETGVKWDDSKDANNWKYFVETAAARIHAKNPNLLIIVEGIDCYNWQWGWWGGNLMPEADFPINLGEHQDKLVFSPHEYGPTPDGSNQAWFHDGQDLTYDGLYASHWGPMWMYIIEQKIAPILIGEWNGHPGESEKMDMWLAGLQQLIGLHGLSFSYWSYWPGDMIGDDWLTPIPEQYELVRPLLAPLL